MGLFRHPHLVRGVVHTPEGAFQIDRGLVRVSDEVGDALGWKRVDEEHTLLERAPRAAAPNADHAGAA